MKLLTNTMLKKINREGFVFPYFIKEYYYTDVFDLKMTSNYKQFEASGFSKHLKLLSYFINDFNVIDMTGNIGCDAVNMSTALRSNSIFTCELDELKAKCLQRNCENCKNIFVFSGNSDILLKYMLEENLSGIMEMCISKNKTRITKEMLSKKLLINIDPPFGETYNKLNPACELEFCGKDILDYFYEYDVKYSDKILEYIIKSPTNWNHATILNKNHDSLKSFNSFIEYGICYVNTSKSGFIYNLYTSYELRKSHKMTGGILLNNVINTFEKSQDYKDLVKLNNDYINKFNLKKYSNIMNVNEYNDFITKLFTDNSSVIEVDAILMTFIIGIGKFETIEGRHFHAIPNGSSKDFNTYILFTHLINMFMIEHGSDNVPLEFRNKFKYLFIIKMCIEHGLDMQEISMMQTNIYDIYEEYVEDIMKLNINDINGDMEKLYKKYGNDYIECKQIDVDNFIYKQLCNIMFPVYSHKEIMESFKLKFVK